ncbi:MurR/RpiR family transcriptional regulator [Marinilactibacillus kalidii]|uniref:MurR/RpiR family transcriptional regulator n=1 Tax=Marinilactibacillus kalidii TaxID=2820274 RepID=UPI001ABDAE34|nr:MurR/RpiR family transcriptional regulator [Marinilactibacillus kalidii]
MNPISVIESNLETFTKAEKRIAEFILKDPIRIVQYSADEIAEAASSSKSAFIRLCQKIGYQGYAEFRFSLSKYLIAHKEKADEHQSISQSITSAYSESIKQVSQNLTDEDIEQLCQTMFNAEKTKIFGNNRTGLSAQQLRMRMAKIGMDSEYVSDPILMNDIVNSLTEKDLVIVFSIRGMSYYEDIAKQVQQNDTSSILITMTPNSPINKYFDIVITLPLISRATDRFLDDQAIFLVFIEILLAELAEFNHSDRGKK